MPPAVGFVFFLATLAAADAALRRRGSGAIRRRPRPGGRVTAIFVAVCMVCAGFEGLSALVWRSSPLAAIVLFALQVPAAAATALRTDHLLPQK
jgi:hypothetical protein